MSLPDLIGKQGVAGFDLDFDNVNKVIVADFRESTAVLTAIASDISRFASAAFQTIQQVPGDVLDKDRTAWGIIQSYYAAYYAGHAILRLVGESCSYFDRSHISRINRLGMALGKVPSFPLSATAYHCVIDTTSTVVRSSSLRDGAGGAHEVFWNTFGIRLRKISEGVLLGHLGENERQEVFGKLEDLRRNICAENAHLFNHLSAIRNEVQYRHAREVWLPTSLRKTDREQLSRLVGQWKRDPMAVDLGNISLGSLGKFSVTCAFLVSLCVGLLKRIAERSPTPARSFARLGPLAIISKR